MEQISPRRRTHSCPSAAPPAHRLVNLYTLADSSSPTPPLNASYAPLTILAPDSVAFLRRSRLDPGSLAGDPLQAVLLAPTLGAHFVRGYFPASALPSERIPPGAPPPSADRAAPVPRLPPPPAERELLVS
jgi:hypothetical protein